MFKKWMAAVVCAAVMAAPASAAVLSFSGFLNDPGNTALVGSDMGAAQFVDDFTIANNVALHTLSITTAGNYDFVSLGFAAGGVDPYFTVFAGSAPAATFLGSNFATAFSTGGDFTLNLALDIGTYTLAIGAFANMSFAENLGSGTLGDGFTGLGVAQFLGDSFYDIRVDVGGPRPPIPIPSTVLLLLAGCAALVGNRKRDVY